MKPAQFLIGQLPSGELRWASIDPNARFSGSEIGTTRFGGYLKPFPSEDAARGALEAAGALQIEAEPDRKRRRG